MMGFSSLRWAFRNMQNMQIGICKTCRLEYAKHAYWNMLNMHIGMCVKNPRFFCEYSHMQNMQFAICKTCILGYAKHAYCDVHEKPRNLRCFACTYRIPRKLRGIWQIPHILRGLGQINDNKNK